MQVQVDECEDVCPDVMALSPYLLSYQAACPCGRADAPVVDDIGARDREDSHGAFC